MDHKDILQVNQQAWDAQVLRGNRWTRPVDAQAIAAARGSTPQIVLTPNKFVPREWFPNLQGCSTLMLASGGGQQAPLVAAAGANVTVVDLSSHQLAQDRFVAERDGLQLKTVQASMDDLSELASESFDLIIQPCSNCFVPDLQPVWSEVARVARSGAVFMLGFCSPIVFLFDEEDTAAANLEVRYRVPYSDLGQLPRDRLEKLRAEDEPLMFGHSLSHQLGMQLKAGFQLTDLYEDTWSPVQDATDASDGNATSEGKIKETPAQGESQEGSPGWQRLDGFISSFMATRAVRV